MEREPEGIYSSPFFSGLQLIQRQTSFEEEDLEESSSGL